MFVGGVYAYQMVKKGGLKKLQNVAGYTAGSSAAGGRFPHINGLGKR